VGAGVSVRAFRSGVACATAGVAAFLLAQLHAWPPHEDETLALFIGQQPLGEMLDTVLGERGGAPLHFLLVHITTWISPSLTGLRLLSVVFAVASIPVVALLIARLVDRRTSLVATVLVAASWVTLFHGIYGRMYSLFLFTSALSFLAFLRAVADNRRLSWALWALATLATIATHQYGAFVVAIEVLYLLIARWRGQARLMPAAIALAALLVAAIPAWRSTLVLASRFEVGVGDGSMLGGPWPVLQYLRSSFGDFVAGWTAVFAIVCALAAFGLYVLARERGMTAVLIGLTFLVPAAGLTIAGAGGASNAPETRHLIFTLPFFAALVATGILRAVRPAGARAPAAIVLSVAAVVAAEIAWGWETTPTLYAGEPPRRAEAREAAEAWLAATARPSDVYFGYDPLFLGAREKGADIGQTVVPRADPKLALDALLEAPQPLGRGVWVLDRSDGSRTVSNWSSLLEIDDRSPGATFETRVFGPFMVVRSLEPTVTPEEFLRDTMDVQRTQLVQAYPYSYWDIANAQINDHTARAALDRLYDQRADAADAAPAKANR
jgi:hypothetical protein